MSAEGPLVFSSFTGPRDDLFPEARPLTSTTSRVKEMSPGQFQRDPQIGVARKCNADHSICKEGVVTSEVTYTTRMVGSEWILEGDLTSAIARTATLTVTTLGLSQTFTHSIPAEVALIDDELVRPKHFRWAIHPGTSLDVDGPTGIHFHAEVGKDL